jgi:hypothetical protein
MRRWLWVAPLLLAAVWALSIWSPSHEAPESVGDAPVPTAPEPAPMTAEPAPSAVPPPAKPEPQVEELDPERERDHAEAPAEPPKPAWPMYGQLPELPPPMASGPVSRLKARFGSESASDASKTNERRLSETVLQTGPPPELLDDVVCRRTVCRISMRWKTERMIPLMQAVGVLRRDYDRNLGTDAPGPLGKDAVRHVDLYVDLASTRPPMP